MRSGVVGIAVLAGALAATPAAAETTMHNAVAELFTSQGCSSCPAADSLLRQMAAANPDILMLSFHVHYWDALGWKDPFSSLANTQRQAAYARGFGDKQVYTPELVVNGAAAVVGSDEIRVKEQLDIAKVLIPLFDIEIAPVGKKHVLAATLHPQNSFAAARQIEVWQVGYAPFARTEVKGGENDGRTLENIDNVTFLKKLDAGADGSYALDARGMARGKMAVLVQGLGQGRIFAAATYEK